MQGLEDDTNWLALLGWYRAMGVDTATAGEAIDWLARGDTPVAWVMDAPGPTPLHGSRSPTPVQQPAQPYRTPNRGEAAPKQSEGQRPDGLAHGLAHGLAPQRPPFATPAPAAFRIRASRSMLPRVKSSASPDSSARAALRLPKFLSASMSAGQPKFCLAEIHSLSTPRAIRSATVFISCLKIAVAKGLLSE